MHNAHGYPLKIGEICFSHANRAWLRRAEQAPSSSTRAHICAAQHKPCQRGRRHLGWSNLQPRRPTMSFTTHPATSTLSTPTEFPFAWRTRLDETVMVGVAGREIGSA